MVAAIVIFGLAYALIATGRIPHVLVAFLGAIAMVVAGVVPEENALGHVDLEVILLLAAMMSMAEVISRTGVFEWAAIRAAQSVRGSGFGTMALMAGTTAAASAFLDNVTVVVLAVPITLSICRTLGVAPIPFLLAQVFASNIGGASTIIADPPNIIIAAAADIAFVEFMVNVAPAAVLGMIALTGILYFWFGDQVDPPAENRRTVMVEDASARIRDRRLLAKSGAVFGLTMIGFLVHDLLHVSPAIVAAAGATVLVLISRIDPHEVARHVEWTTLAFFTGLFILVGGLVESGVTVAAQQWMVDVAAGSERDLAFMLIWLGGLISALVDNIPYTATMVEVVGGIAGPESGHESPLWWAMALGADLGGNATLVGASANVVAVTVARSHGHAISFFHFFRYGIVISVVTLLISTAYIWLRFYL